MFAYFLLVQINWNVYNKEQKIQERKAVEENYGSIWGKGMEKDVLTVLGNGFSIDFVNFIQKNEIINLTNLFCNGDKVLWPADNYPGFLSKILKEKAVEAAYKLQEDDDVIYGGISYCNVDRAEIDEQIICLNSDVNFRIINPDAQNTFCAVISSLFKQYIHYTQSEVLGGLYK